MDIKLRYSSILLFLFFSSQSNGQIPKDLALWENIYLEKKISTRWVAHLNQQGRITENISQFSYAYADMGITYKWSKFFHSSFDYIFIKKYPNTGIVSTRHQFYASFTFKQKLGSFLLTDRNMFQSQLNDIYTAETGYIPDYYYRNKLTIKYKWQKYRPYIAYEIYLRLSSPRAYFSDRYRCFFGCFYELNKTNELELYNMFENQYNRKNPKMNFIIGVGLSHTFY